MHQSSKAFFEKDSVGNNVDVGFGRDIYFKKTSNGNEVPMIWNANRWGYIIQPSPRIIELNEITDLT